jgi:hypothetical protein
VHGRDLLAIQLSVVVLVEQKELHDTGCEARDAPKLRGIDWVHDVHDFEGGHAHDVAGKAGVGQVARMPA